MAGINNKKELFDALSNFMLQGFTAQGEPMMFSIFEELDRNVASTINKKINQNLHTHLRTTTEVFEMSPTEYLRIISEDILLETAEEVGQFLFHAGYMFGLLDSAIEDARRKREEDNQ